MSRNKKILAAISIFLIAFIGSLNYLMSDLTKTENLNYPADLSYEQKILQHLRNLPDNYHTRQTYLDNITDKFLRSLEIDKTIKNVWKVANGEVQNGRLFNVESPNLGNVLKLLRTSKIVKADLDGRGTQLKLLLTLEGNQSVVFKPQWYPLNKTIIGPVYAGKDRHQSEILSFYLSALLNKPLAPISTHRSLNLQSEIIPVATPQLLKTSYQSKNVTCIYGQCFYCKREDPVCDWTGKLEGAVIFNLGAGLRSHRSPWSRTYKKSKKALWESNENFCKTLSGKVSKQRLYDLVDTAIFDFLIQNGDRHHYETLDDRVIWIDNGKGLGNPNIHHIDILAPLYQCCILRGDTWSRLQQLSGGLLSEKLRTMPEVPELITNEHLEAMDKRLLIIFATVEFCRNRNKIKHNAFR